MSVLDELFQQFYSVCKHVHSMGGGCTFLLRREQVLAIGRVWGYWVAVNDN